MRLRVLAAAAVMLVLNLSARADQIFNLSGVTLSSVPGGAQNAGTLTGSFTTNDALSAILSYNITASASGAFSGFTYTTGNSSVAASTLPSQYFQLDSAGSANELRIYFSNGLSKSGGSISGSFSYEHENSGGNRFLSGSVVAAPAVAATPEPSSFALLGTGILGVIGAARRRFHA